MKDFFMQLYHIIGALALVIASLAMGFALAAGCLPASSIAPVLGATMFLVIYLGGMHIWLGTLAAITGKALTKGFMRSILRGLWNFVSGRHKRTLKTLLTDMTDLQEHDIDQEKMEVEFFKASRIFRNLGLTLGTACGLTLGLIGIRFPDTRLVLLPIQRAFLDQFLDAGYWLEFQTTHLALLMLIYAAAGWGYGLLLARLARSEWLPVLM